jgi:tRNA(Ile)-lysidine synthase
VASSGARGSRGKASLARKARGLMARESLFPSDCRALVMVSGGQDSLALLHILADLAGRPPAPVFLHALHVNHHLRGAESDDDEALVVRACGELEVGLTIVHRPVAKAEGNVQETAREARRGAALQVADERRCDRIALGHTADDQVETMLYRLGRYGGMAAFRGMLPCDPPWVRPLLDARRAETAAYCRAHGLVFAEDRGNTYPAYARTAMREQVLPAWEAALPGAVAAGARAAEVAAEMQTLVDGLLAEAERRVVMPRTMSALRHDPVVSAGRGSADEVLSVPGLAGLEAPLRRLFLHRWLERRARPAASRASVLVLESLMRVPGSAERALGGAWTAVKEYDELWIVPGPRLTPAEPCDPVVLPIPGRVCWGGAWVSARPVARYRAPDISREAFVDAESLSGTVEVRGPHPGDRMRPLGAAGTRKVHDILVDLRVPAVARATVPLVVRNGRVLWVCGMLVAEEGRITRETTGIVRLAVRWSRLGETPDEPSEGGWTEEQEGDGQR